MKKILILIVLVFSIVSCKSEREKCVRKCAQAAIVDLQACSKLGKTGGDSEGCTRAAKKKGRDCLDTCPAK